MLKKVAVALLVTACVLPVQADEISDTIRDALESYEAQNYTQTTQSLNYAIQLLASLNADRLGLTGYDNPHNPGHMGSGSGAGAKIASLGLAGSPSDLTFKVDLTDANGNGVSDVNYFRFGSWHPGISQFVFGDCRVVSVKNFTDRTALYNMSHRSDGQPYNLP